MRNKWDAAIDYDSFQIAVLMNWVEYKMQQNYRVSEVNDI
jgi:hypothetical protein